MKSNEISDHAYRSDIDGLRAIAVFSVVLYHYFPNVIKGGFVGVDIFFVISGYLITKNIIKESNFDINSIRYFYIRRINRIFPGLITILIFFLVFGWFVLLDGEYKQIGKHVFTSATFTSNIALWRESGYFDKVAETKPLLHLWSLSVEEQFYLLFPLIIYIAKKYKKELSKLLIATVILSLAVNVTFISKYPTATFYLPFGRMWEMLVGGILAVYSYKNPDIKHINNKKFIVWIIYIVSTLILIYSFIFLSDKINYPGYWAILPVTASILIIFAGNNKINRSKLITNKHLVYMGIISYPIYLWHWPLYSFARIISGDNLSIKTKISLIILTLVLGHLTYKYIEVKLKIKFSENEKSKAKVLLVILTIVGSSGLLIFLNDGIDRRAVVQNNANLKSGEDGGIGQNVINQCGLDESEISKKIAVCKKDNRGPSKYALIGDSKAAALFPGLIRTSTEDGRWLLIGDNGPYGPPLPVISNEKIYKKYQDLTLAAIEALKKNEEIKIVVMAASTRILFDLSNDKDINDLPSNQNENKVFEGLSNTIKILLESDKKVIIVVDNPTLPYPEDCLSRKTEFRLINLLLTNENPKCEITIDKHLELSGKYRKILFKLSELYPNQVVIFDTVPLLCELDKNICSHRKFGRHLYMFTDHISDFASGLIGKKLNELLNSM